MSISFDAQAPGWLAADLALPPFALDDDAIEELVYRHGCNYDSYLATDAGREIFWSHDGQGLVSLARVGRYLKAGGGLIAPPERRGELLAELVTRSELREECLSFYNINEDALPLFRRQGFQATKLGEEAVIDLDDWSCTAKAFEWLRRQTNYCRRQGLRMVECIRPRMSPGEWERLLEELWDTSAAFLATKPQSAELRFLDGTFDPRRLGRRRIFVARGEQGAGRIECFLICNPYLEGAGWAFEIYRQRPDAPRGGIPFLMRQVIGELKLEGARRVSLCLVPGMRCQRLPGDSPLVRHALAIGSRYFNFVFDTAGLYHFKSRFRPRWEARYLCARPAVTFASAWALVQLLGVVDLDPGKLARTLIRRFSKRRSRATLAVPGQRRVPRHP